MRIAVFVSGRGSNLNAILANAQVDVAAVFSDKQDCGAFEIAKKHSIPVFPLSNKPGSVEYKDLCALLISMNIDLIVLAGFLKLVPEDVVTAFPGKIINIHPALLPAFGGKGMYGMNVHKAVYDSSAKVSGATVHFVDSTFDTGKIIAQKCVDISDVKSPEEIASRVLEIEHVLLPYVIRKFAGGKIENINGRIVIN